MPIFEQYIKSRKVKVVVASLAAISRFDTQKAKHYALELITHPISRVREKAIETLGTNVDSLAMERIRGIYANSNFETKMTILKLYGNIGGWSVIGDIVLALADGNADIQRMGWMLLNKWMAKAPRLFTTPTEMDVNRAISNYNSLDIEAMKYPPGKVGLLENLMFYLK